MCCGGPVVKTMKLFKKKQVQCANYKGECLYRNFRKECGCYDGDKVKFSNFLESLKTRNIFKFPSNKVFTLKELEEDLDEESEG